MESSDLFTVETNLVDFLNNSKACSLETTVFITNTQTGSTFVITGDIKVDLNSMGLQFQVVGKDCSIYFKTSVLTDRNEV